MLLCAVHVLRYFREKVLTGKGFWGEIEKRDFLSSNDKDQILKLLISVRDSPNESQYYEREKKLLEETKELTVRPGQTTNPVSFHDYYTKCWKDVAFR